MIDKALIRENYANMNDGQLLVIAREDATRLEPDAFEILRAEFTKRKLDYSFIENAEAEKLAIHQQKIQQVRETIEDEYLQNMWKYVLDEKENGTPHSEILKGLQERGLEDPHASLLIDSTQDKLNKIIDSYDTTMLVGGVSFLLGTFITMFTFTAIMEEGGYYYIAWGAIVFGLIKFFSGLNNKNKYKAILAKIVDHEGAA